VFEDLDEIVHRFVEPMVGYSNDMVGFEKFCFGAAEDVRMVLEEEKKVQSHVVPYCVSVSEDKPGQNPRHHTHHTNIPSWHASD